LTGNPKEQGRTAQASLKAMNAAQKKAEQLGKHCFFNQLSIYTLFYKNFAYKDIEAEIFGKK